MKVDGKVAIITGGTRGIGKAITTALLRQGAKVCFCGLDVSQGNKTAGEFQDSFGPDKAIFIKCDVTSQEEFEALFQKTKDKFGGVDIVCNNAGIISDTNWELTVDVNLTAVIRGTLLGMQHLKRSEGGNGGVIINISSIAGLMVFHGDPTYSATKHGVIGYTRSWAANPDMQKEGIRLNTICPALVDTDMGRNVQLGDAHGYDAAVAMRENATFMKPEVIADAFMQLVLDDTKNGAVQQITVDGIDYKE